ncbi:MAG: bifunctional DNA-formamidopyrimidine glycosylase/DNA-(apurinic or apyrimidinic site) lyase [Corynebacterium sp.]|nr:bifunctional DNA-formamidopyrimidine glycosylase/DNA-(apurinic or apyrimidinic site) lyase [Corynebacterium sp.]
MPELPEVEVVRRGLAEHIHQRTFTDVAVHHLRAIRGIEGGAPELEATLIDATVTNLARRGKFLWLELGPQQAGEPVLLVHLGMSGQMLIKEPDAGPVDPNFKHCRIQTRLDDDNQLWFVDQRTFGYWLPAHLTDAGQGLVPHTMTHIARDLLDPELDLKQVVTKLKAKHLEIKKLLLNQEIIAGIGNIYADEMLWEARIHPNTPADCISKTKLTELLTAGQQVMRGALAQGGTSFDALYVNVNGQSGYFDVQLQAYGQDGLPCSRCGTTLVKEKFTNRSSHYCPRCQRL